MEEKGERLEDPKVVSESKETVSSSHNRTGAHMNSEMVAAWGRPVQVQARQGPTSEKRK